MTQPRKIGDISFWYADIGLPSQRRKALAGDTTADVAIIGAGYTGLWAAYYLKKADPALDVLVIEKEFAGYGASGRNGGWLTGGFSWSREKYIRAGGTRQGVIDMGRALRGTVDEVIRVAEAQGIDEARLLGITGETLGLAAPGIDAGDQTPAGAAGDDCVTALVREVEIALDNALAGAHLTPPRALEDVFRGLRQRHLH